MMPRILIALLASVVCTAHAQKTFPESWEDRLRVDLLYGPSFRLGGTEAPAGSLIEAAYGASSLGRWSMGASYAPFGRLFVSGNYSWVEGDGDEKVYDRFFSESNPGYFVQERESNEGGIALITLGLEYQIPWSIFMIEPGISAGLSIFHPPTSKIILKEDGGNIYKRIDVEAPYAHTIHIIPSLTMRLISDTRNLSKDSTTDARFGLLMRMQYIRTTPSISRMTTETIPPAPTQRVTENVSFTYESFYFGIGISFLMGW